MIDVLVKGVIIGILVSAPMGPVGMLCIQRTLSKGQWHGLVTGIGATISDVIYACITSLGMGFVVNFIETNQTPLQFIGSIIIGFFGVYIYRTNPSKSLQKQGENKQSYTQDFFSAFFLTLSNILITLLYIGLFARFGFVLPEHTVWITLCGIGGIAIGAILWWTSITYIVSKLRRWFNVRSIWVLNKVIGIVIMGVSLIGTLSVIYTYFYGSLL